jgi:hypothetical protein
VIVKHIKGAFLEKRLGISFPPTRIIPHISKINLKQSKTMFSDIFLFAVFSIIVIIFEMISRGALTMDMIQGILSGNTSIYIILAIAIFFSRKYLMGMQDKNNNNLERTLLTLSNELQRIRTEAEWRNDVSSQGMACDRKKKKD